MSDGGADKSCHSKHPISKRYLAIVMALTSYSSALLTFLKKMKRVQVAHVPIKCLENISLSLKNLVLGIQAVGAVEKMGETDGETISSALDAMKQRAGAWPVTRHTQRRSGQLC